MTIPHRARRLCRLLLALSQLLLSGGIMSVHAQSATATLGEGGPRDQHRAGRQRNGAAAPAEGEMTPKLKEEPIQRLDAGALLCKSKAELEAHLAAVTARLNGNDAAEPAGCHLVQAMTAVTVVQRDGLARTEVKAGTQLGWTDTMIRSP